MKLQQAIQERLSKVEKIKLSVDLSGENPKEAWAQTGERVRQLEGEISELQRRNAELEQLSQTDDNLHFLQVCLIVQKMTRNSNVFFSFLWSSVSICAIKHCTPLTLNAVSLLSPQLFPHTVSSQ